MSASEIANPTRNDLYRVARDLLRAGKFEQAERAWRAIVKRAPADTEAVIAMGRICTRLGVNDEALRHFAAVPWADDIPLRLIKAYANCLAIAVARQPAEARTMLAGIDVARHVSWARLLEANGFAGSAAGLYRALFLVTGDQEICRQFVACLQRNDRVNEAIAFLTQVQAQQPAERWIYLFKAAFLCGIDKSYAAQRTLLAGIAARPDDVRLRIRLARLLATRRRWQASIRAWREVGLLIDDPARVLLEIADCHRQAGAIAGAIETYRKAIRYAANQGDRAYFGYTTALRLAGRGDEAVSFLRESIARSPHDIHAWSNLVYTLEQMDRYDEALSALWEARRVLGNAPAMVCVASRIAERGRFFDEAQQVLTGALAEQPEAIEIRLELGRFYLRRGQVGEASRVFRAAERITGSTEQFANEHIRIGAIRRLLRVDPRDGDDTQLPEAAIRHIVTLRRSLIGSGIPGRVAIVSPIGAIGGAERQAVLTATALSQLDRPVESVSFHAATPRPDRRDNPHLSLIAGAPIELTSLPSRGCPHLLSHALVAPHRELLHLLPRDLAKATAGWLVEFKTRRPAVVHGWQDVPSVAATLAAILAGVPRIVMSLRSIRPREHRRLRRYLRTAYLNFLDADGIVMANNSQSGASDYEDWLGIERGRVRIVRNGIDGGQLDRDWGAAAPGAIRRRLNLPADAVVVGGAFRLTEDKRPLLWIDAAAQVARSVPNAHFLICGGGALSNDMRRRGAELGIGDRLHLAGEQWPIAPWYRAMDLFMLASGREGMPNVLLEAQFLRVPVVSSAVGGVREVLQPGRTGWAVDNADASSLAERVVWSLGHPEWLCEAGRAARDFVGRSFSVSAMVAGTLDLYQL